MFEDEAIIACELQRYVLCMSMLNNEISYFVVFLVATVVVVVSWILEKLNDWIASLFYLWDQIFQKFSAACS